MATELTICMPVHNAQEYLQRSVGSILNQTYGDFRLLIYDDGSTDDGMSVVESFRDSRIEVVRGDVNKGGIFARSRLIDALDTKYCMWCDADDFFCNTHAFGKAVEAISSGDYDIVNFVNYLKVFPDGKRVRNEAVFHKDTFSYSGDRLIEDCFRIDSPIVFWSKIFRSELLKKCIPEESVLSYRTPQDDMFYFMMWWFHARKYLNVVGSPSFYAHCMYIGVYGSTVDDFSEGNIRAMCLSLRTYLLSLYNRMTEIRPLSDKELYALLRECSFGYICDKIRKLRERGDEQQADALAGVFHEYFFADGVHAVNGIELFEVPDFIELIESIIHNKQ